MDRLEALKSLLGINDDDTDIVLQFVLDTVQDQVLSYINHETLPESLERPLVAMAAGYYKGAGLGTSQPAPGPVSSISRGDLSTSFAVASGAAATDGTFNLSSGDGFFGWKTVLNAHRKLRW